jgi:restriction system protein
MDQELPIWMVRAGEGGTNVDIFLGSGIVGLQWREVGPIEAGRGDDEIEARFAKAYPDAKEGTRRVWASQVKRFLREFKVGDAVATYDREHRLYFLGSIAGNAEWRDGPICHVRKVHWTQQVARDVLSTTTRNSLGSIATLFRPPPAVTRELAAKAVPIGSTAPSPPSPAEEQNGEDRTEVVRDIEEKANQFLEDRIAALDWQEMQELVAAILRAMGYKTRVSKEGPDRGVDVFASPDGLGLQEPRIFVEVKHHPNTPMGAPEVRTFLGGRKAADRCLYVSTGGFSKEARYEADRATIPLTLVTLPELRALLVDHYEALDPDARSLVPLKRFYWPAPKE